LKYNDKTERQESGLQDTADKVDQASCDEHCNEGPQEGKGCDATAIVKEMALYY
jgi:hypothetical protein